MRLDDPLGHLVPPGSVAPIEIERTLVRAMDRYRYAAGLGVPSIPTRYVVSIHPADRAWLDASTEDRLARALDAHATTSDALVVGDISVEFRLDRTAARGTVAVWAGFTDDDLLVLADADAALRVFTGA